MAYYSTQETSAIEPAKQFESRWKKGDGKEEATEVSMKLCLFFFVCQDIPLWSLSMKNIN